MNILVCMKQVPGTSKVEIDPETGVLKRAGVDSKMNPYDLYALETALRLKEQHGGKVTAITMGPPQAEQILREAYSMGADEGVLITDRRFGGADVLATSYTLAQGIRKAGSFDIILCGQQTTDGDTAQVGPEISEWLGIPSVSWVKRILDSDGSSLTIEMEMPDCVEVAKLPYPCLITVEKDIFMPRLPSYRKKTESGGRPVRKLALDDMDDKDETHYGLNGSPTQVQRIFPPETDREQEIWGGDGADLADRLFGKLRDLKFV